MVVELYYVPSSPPCRAVLLTARAIDLKMNLNFINVMEGEQFEPYFLKMNPLHTVPTMKDGDLSLGESRVIMTYLVNKYGKTDALYPKDPKKRAMVDQRLYFEIVALNPHIRDYIFPVFFEESVLNKSAIPGICSVLNIINNLLGKTAFFAGETLTIADLSLVTYISTLDVLDFDLSQYQNIIKWYERVKKSAPGYEDENGKNVLSFRDKVHELCKGRT
ncbi:PREDICTED: glutathione S-transferase 1-like [Nicrophorus vespilloides]|uniref:Glutathione S-transferase 1-like n=1 Tax=Nicrophorus vespilloides TaxID=110193 RepID=A0ABM1MGT3_NICVS|nr:PREDICTED: glutathione S-transferase 1-like [Nicrophorus vespilloides]